MTLLRSFGLVGMTSILAWMAALVVLAVGWRHKRRSVFLVAGLVVALAGLGLAELNSLHVSAIQPDRSAYILRGHEHQAEVAEAAAKAEAEKLGKEEAEAPAEPEEPKEKPAYDYRKGGKRKRDAGKRREVVGLKAMAEPEQKDDGVFRMSETEVTRANRYDRINLFFARLVPWLAVGLIVLDYLLRFNPVVGRMASAMARGKGALQVHSPEEGTLNEYLEARVRRGTSFIFFGSGDPFPEGVLHRLHVWKWRLKPLPRMLHDPDAHEFDSEFAFDCVWFARYALVVAGREPSERLFGDLLGYLRQRRVPRAAAFRTVDVVWDFAEPLPPETVEEMEFLAKETNFRLVLRPSETAASGASAAT